MTIICNIYNLPDDTTTTNISWFVKRNGNSQATRLSVESEKYSVGQSEKPTLTIHEFSLEDEGIYICEVENDVGLKKSGSSNLQFIGEHLSYYNIKYTDLSSEGDILNVNKQYLTTVTDLCIPKQSCTNLTLF